MILNTTSKPFFEFSAMQRLATHGEPVTSKYVTTIEEFDAFYDMYSDSVTMVIVSPDDFILANDICNAVECPVVTLDVHNVFDMGVWGFCDYIPE